MRLHGRNRLDTTCARADDGNTVIFPLFLLVIVWPPCCVDDFALEFLHSFDVRPLVVIQNPSTVQEDMASLFEEADCRAIRWVCLLELDKPFASLLLPVTANDFRVESHVFPETPYFAHLIQIFPDVWAVREKAWPIGLGDHEADLTSATY